MSLQPNLPTKQHKVTAARVAKPPVDDAAAKDVALLGSNIREHLKKMRSYEAEARKKADVPLRKAQNNYDTITRLLVEAKAKCDRAGFRKFRAKYCPDLGRSRVYELLQIGSGKKTLEESRTAKRASVAKSRKKGENESTTSDVADKPEVEPLPTAIGNVQPSTAAPAKSAEVEVVAEPDPDPEGKTDAAAAPPAIVEITTEQPPAGDDDTLVCVIRREWLALEALTSHTVAQVAQAIDPDIALLQEISGFIAALIAAKLAARFVGGATTGPDRSIPADLNVPGFLQRGGAAS